MTRVLTAARLHMIRPATSLGTPWLILATSFAINLVVWGFTDAGDQPGGGTTGGLLTLYAVLIGVFVQAFSQLMPLAMGISLDRRDFYLGTGLYILAQSIVYSVVLTALNRLERATGGWGLRLHFFGVSRLDVDDLLLQVLVYLGPMLLVSAAGVAIGVVFKRWAMPGLTVLTMGAIVLAGLLIVLVTRAEAWHAVGAWFTDTPIAALAFGWPALAAVAIGGLAYVPLRRTVP